MNFNPAVQTFYPQNLIERFDVKQTALVDFLRSRRLRSSRVSSWKKKEFDTDNGAETSEIKLIFVWKRTYA